MLLASYPRITSCVSLWLLGRVQLLSLRVIDSPVLVTVVAIIESLVVASTWIPPRTFTPSSTPLFVSIHLGVDWLSGSDQMWSGMVGPPRSVGTAAAPSLTSI